VYLERSIRHNFSEIISVMKLMSEEEKSNIIKGRFKDIQA